MADRAPETGAKNWTDFVLEAADEAAEEALLDQSVMRVAPNEQLRRTIWIVAPWGEV